MSNPLEQTNLVSDQEEINETQINQQESAKAANAPDTATPTPGTVGTVWSSELIARPGKMFEWARRSSSRTRLPLGPSLALDGVPGSLARAETFFLADAACSADPSASVLAGSASLKTDATDPAVERTQHLPFSSHNRVKSEFSVPSLAPRSASSGSSAAEAAAGGSPPPPSRAHSSSPPNNGVTKKYLSIAESLLARTLASEQQASLTLQQLLRSASPQQLATLQREILARLPLMVVSRFGNFVVQRMIEVSDKDFVENVVFGAIRGQVAALSLNSFACYVLQKLLDVGSQQMRQQILDEMLAKVVQTITNAFGTHVWQKLLHLPWPDTLPSVVKQVSMALDAVYCDEIQHAAADEDDGEGSGWMYILAYPPGAAAVRSLIGASHLPGAAQVLNRLSQSLDDLIANPNLQSIALRMAQGVNVYRDRVLEHVLLNANAYAHSPQVVPFLKELLALNIPSFKQKLRARLSDVPPELASALVE